jgi:hypothetical protein
MIMSLAVTVVSLKVRAAITGRSRVPQSRSESEIPRCRL